MNLHYSETISDRGKGLATYESTYDEKIKSFTESLHYYSCRPL